jgi:hypothetical protein
MVFDCLVVLGEIISSSKGALVRASSLTKMEVGTTTLGGTSVTCPMTLQDYLMPPIDSKKVDYM